MIIACNENRVRYNPICSKWEKGNKSKLVICILIQRDDNALTLSFWHHFCWMSHQPVFRSLGINLKSKDTKQITFKYGLLNYIDLRLSVFCGLSNLYIPTTIVTWLLAKIFYVSRRGSTTTMVIFRPEIITMSFEFQICTIRVAFEISGRHLVIASCFCNENRISDEIIILL